MNKYENIENMVMKLNSLEKHVYLNLKNEVDYIINNDVRDIYYIEEVLDRLLSLSTVDFGTDFYRLCDYYKYIRKDNALEYIKMYKDYKEEEDDE